MTRASGSVELERWWLRSSPLTFSPACGHLSCALPVFRRFHCRRTGRDTAASAEPCHEVAVSSLVRTSLFNFFITAAMELPNAATNSKSSPRSRHSIAQSHVRNCSS